MSEPWQGRPVRLAGRQSMPDAAPPDCYQYLQHPACCIQLPGISEPVMGIVPPTTNVFTCKIPCKYLQAKAAVNI